MAAPLPSRIGRYRILGVLGLCGPVYVGRDDVSGRDVVMKPIRGGFERGAFDVKAEVTARLNHPSVPQFLGFERHDGVLYVVVEHAEGQTLTEAVRSGVSIGWALRVIAQVLDVLSYAHAAGILHGDIKPSNIVVPSQGPVKMFGLGTAASGDPTGTRSPEVARYVGGPGYMSPEVILGRPFGPGGDLFSVGCVLFEVAAGCPPFRAHLTDSLVEVLRQTIYEEPDYDLLPSGSEWKRLRSVIERALRKKPEHRYADAAAMRADLDLALKDLGSSEERSCPRPSS